MLTLAVAAPLALRGHRGGADAAAGGARPGPRGPHGGRRGSASRSRWPSSAATTSWCSRRRAARSSGSRTARSQGPVLDLAVNSAPSAGCSASRCTRSSAATAGSTCSGARAARAPTASAGDGVRLMGNRVDRFEWDDGQLEFDRNIIRFRAFQAGRAGSRCAATTTAASCASGPTASCTRSSATPAAAARRRTSSTGPFAPPASPDDQFGGPEPDDAHRTGVIVRLNDDGDAPRDNPFFARRRGDGRRGRREHPEDLSPTASATASAWPSTPSRATCGSRRTATTRSASSTASSRA